VGRLFREFAVVLTLAIGFSLLVSLSVTPMMCSRLLKPSHAVAHGRLYRLGEWVFDGVLGLYARTLRWGLRYRLVTLLITIGTVCLNIYLFVIVPKGFFPQQDTGRLIGSIQADQDISFPAMRDKMREYVDLVMTDPAVANTVAFTGGNLNTTNT